MCPFLLVYLYAKILAISVSLPATHLEAMLFRRVCGFLLWLSGV
jgi:hypothetical protein